MSRKGPLKVMKAVGIACRGMLDFVEDCGLDVTLSLTLIPKVSVSRNKQCRKLSCYFSFELIKQCNVITLER